MSRFGINLIPGLPATRLNNHSPLLKGFSWPNDLEYISCLHGPEWMFYLVSLIRCHLITNVATLFPFTARDQYQALPFMVDLMKLFNPISMLSLYYECLEYYKTCVVAELIDFNEKWYLNIVRSYHTLDDWEAEDWYWRYALRQVIFIPRRGLSQLKLKLPDWIELQGKEPHSGEPECYVVDRFPDMTTRIQGVYQVITNDLKGKAPTVSVDGPWGCLVHPESPFLQAVPNIDHFLLSLYPRMPGQTFPWSMGLDIIQYNWTHTDWKYNMFATKRYNKLRFAEKEGIIGLNKPITSVAAAAIQGGLTGQTPVNYEPQPFHDLRTKIQMLAADVAFDYCSDHELALLVSDLDVLVRNQNFPRQGRASYFTVLKHLRTKIQLYNMVQTQPTTGDIEGGIINLDLNDENNNENGDEDDENDNNNNDDENNEDLIKLGFS